MQNNFKTKTEKFQDVELVETSKGLELMSIELEFEVIELKLRAELFSIPVKTLGYFELSIKPLDHNEPFSLIEEAEAHAEYLNSKQFEDFCNRIRAKLNDE